MKNGVLVLTIASPYIPDVKEASPDILDLLAKAQQRAEAGKTVALGLVEVYSDGTIGTGYVNEGHLFTMIGAVEVMKARLLREVE